MNQLAVNLDQRGQRLCQAFSYTFITNVQSAQSLQLLKRFYSDENTAFHSNEQHAAVDNVLNTSNDILAILPTGCGKSLLFFLYAVVHKGQRTTVVIVPTLSLMQGLMRRATMHVSDARFDVQGNNAWNFMYQPN